MCQGLSHVSQPDIVSIQPADFHGQKILLELFGYAPAQRQSHAAEFSYLLVGTIDFYHTCLFLYIKQSEQMIATIVVGQHDVGHGSVKICPQHRLHLVKNR